MIYRKTTLINAIIYALGLFSISIWIVTKSINECLIFLVAFISSIILLLREEKIKNIGIYFFMVGSVSSFIDLLTAPIVTLGITAITYFLLLQKKQEVTVKQCLVELIRIVIPWALGYGLTWAMKWLIVEISFNRPLISQVIDQILFRSGGVLPNRVIKISLLKTIQTNASLLSSPVVLLLGGVAIVYILATTIRDHKEKMNFKKNMITCLPYMMIFFMPIAWFMVVRQHSYTHSFMVYRILIVSIISILIVASNILKTEKEEEK